MSEVSKRSVDSSDQVAQDVPVVDKALRVDGKGERLHIRFQRGQAVSVIPTASVSGVGVDNKRGIHNSNTPVISICNKEISTVVDADALGSADCCLVCRATVAAETAVPVPRDSAYDAEAIDLPHAVVAHIREVQVSLRIQVQPFRKEYFRLSGRDAISVISALELHAGHYARLSIRSEFLDHAKGKI